MEKAFLSAIAAARFAVPEGYAPAQLLPDLLAGLGSTDPELRDQLCMSILYTWIRKGRFTPDELRAMLPQLLENLAKGIGEGEGDLVFLRSFSAAVLAGIVRQDRDGRFLSETELEHVLTRGLRYFTAEQDLRGYVDGKGWADATTHGADLLHSLARHPGLDRAALERILEAAAAKILAPTQYPIASNEEYRLGIVVVDIVRRDLVPPDRVCDWVRSLDGAEFRQGAPHGQDHGRYRRAKLFLSALHVLLTHQELEAGVREDLLKAAHAALKSYVPWCL